MSVALPPIGWISIVRLGLIQASLGSVVVLTTSLLNRVMVVELGLMAMLPGALVALYYSLQILRPRLGYGSDQSGRRTPWIIGGMAVLALGGVSAAVATAWMNHALLPGIALAAFSFVLIALGIGAAGTNLLVLLAKRVEARRRPAAATIVWLMMIVGFIITTATASQLLDPFTLTRLVAVSTGVSVIAFLVTVAAIWGVEGRPSHGGSPATASLSANDGAAEVATEPFMVALREVWQEPVARQFTLFVFVSMLAYSAQDLILEPFAGAVFGLTPGQSTQLASVQYGGVLLGMIMVGVLGPRLGSLRHWMLAGCLGSSFMLATLAVAGFIGSDFPMSTAVFLLGLGLGTFAVAAIGSMMSLVDAGRAKREGIRMGLFGAAQAIAFGLGGLVATAGIDLIRWLLGSALWAYSAIFLAEALVFLVAAVLALRVGRMAEGRRRLDIAKAGDGYAAGLGS